MMASVDQVRKLQVRKIGAQEKLATYNDEVLRAAIAAEQEASDSRPLMIAMLQGEIDRRAKEAQGMSATLPPVSAPIEIEDLAECALRCLAAVEDLPQLQRLAALKAAVGIAEAAVDHQTRLYMLGAILTKR